MLEKYRAYYGRVKAILDPDTTRTAKLCLTPYIYDGLFWRQMERVTTAYGRLLEFVFKEFPTSRSIQHVLEYPPELERFIASLNIYEKNLAAARIDLFVTPNGLKMVESNAEIPGGNEESYFLEKEYLAVFEPEGLQRVERMEIVYQTLMHYYQIQADHFGLPKKERPTIYLAQWQPEIDRIQGEYDILLDYIRARGHSCGVLDPNAIAIKENHAYTPSGEHIDLIYRRFTADELPKYATKSWGMALEWDQAQVAVVNPFCTKRVDSKNIMVLFKDPAFEAVFPHEYRSDLEVVRAIIPWTTKVKDRIMLKDGSECDAVPYLRSERDALVIKHANSYSSAAVFIGSDTEAAEWEDVIAEALKGDWIVQERIDLPEITVEYFEDDVVKTARCIYNVSPYIYDGRLGGFLNRASTDKLTSFKSGSIATVMPCFERCES